MIKYSFKKASKHSLIGVIIGILPAVITMLASHALLTPTDAQCLTLIVGVFSVAFGTEYSSYVGKKKLAQQDAEAEETRP